MGVKDVGSDGRLLFTGLWPLVSVLRERERERDSNSNSNSKTLFSKDCSLGSFRPV